MFERFIYTLATDLHWGTNGGGNCNVGQVHKYSHAFTLHQRFAAVKPLITRN